MKTDKTVIYRVNYTVTLTKTEEKRLIKEAKLLNTIINLPPDTNSVSIYKGHKTK